jgi:hypothetical protein
MRVALVNMPVSDVGFPSLGLSLLKAALSRRKVTSDIHCLSNWFAEAIGMEQYNALARGKPPVHDLCAGWLFSEEIVWRP